MTPLRRHLDDHHPVVHGAETMTRDECLARLRAGHLGRVALSVDALPAVFPVHYAMVGDDVAFRTGPGTKLEAASSGNIVCLEIDDHDPEFHTGWSVMVTGRARVVTDEAELADMCRLPLAPWIDNADSYVVVEATIVSGRRIGPVR